MSIFAAPLPELPDVAELRARVRALVAAQLPDNPAERRANCWAVADEGFSRAAGAAGLIGMIWPERYGGHARAPLERYAVLEELLAAGAPVGAHWIADRQTGPLLLRHGTEDQKRQLLPAMARGELYAC
ncbi:MAG: acyl-CoA dehydrogenase family protein, partial [Polymorphobacter sp.]